MERVKDLKNDIFLKERKKKNLLRKERKRKKDHLPFDLKVLTDIC